MPQAFYMAFAVFLPLVFILYWAMPHKFRWILLLVASYYFYMSWNAKYVFLILFTTVISYSAAILLEKLGNRKVKKLILAGTAILCLGVYRGDVRAEQHFGYYAVFISFFPQLVAGPIERTRNLLPQLKQERKFDYDQATYGLKLMAWGYFKKLGVADVLSVYVDAAYASLDTCTGFDLLAAVFFFTIQIYCDFSGYSDIAIGTAKLLGVDLMKNFKSPYFSTSIKEFWSRWHISLSTWFRDYVYIPREEQMFCIDRINDLNRYINEHGATLLIAGYPIGSGEYTPDPSEYDLFEKELREKLKSPPPHTKNIPPYAITHTTTHDTKYIHAGVSGDTGLFGVPCLGKALT